jgi:plastocyanin
LIVPSAAALALLAVVPAALADKQVMTAPTDRYTGDVTMDQGETLTLNNGDINTHNVTADDLAPDGKPLFASPDTSPGQTSTVDGAQFLTAGTYAFHCSIHPFMHGKLTVTSNGTPQPRPGSGGGGGGGGGGTGGGGTPPAIDVTAPTVKVAAAQKKRTISVKVTVSEPSAVKLTATLGKKVVARGTTTIPAAGSKTVKLKLNSAGRKALEKKSSVKVKVAAVANDASGNRGSASKTLKLRR